MAIILVVRRTEDVLIILHVHNVFPMNKWKAGLAFFYKVEHLLVKKIIFPRISQNSQETSKKIPYVINDQSLSHLFSIYLEFTGNCFDGIIFYLPHRLALLCL